MITSHVNSTARISAILFLFSIWTASAQWTQYPGPDGMGVGSIAATQNSQVAITVSNVGYISRDHDTRWDPLVYTDGLQLPVGVVAAGLNLVVLDRYKGAFLSADQGDSWTSVYVPKRDTVLFERLVANDSVVYFMGLEGLLSSTDAGRSWYLQEIEFVRSIGDLSVAADHLYITYFGAAFRTSDRGATWDSVIPPDGLEQVSLVWGRGDTVLINDDRLLARSTDGGDSWAVYQLPDTIGFVTCLYHSDSLIFVGTNRGLIVLEPLSKAPVMVTHPELRLEFIVTIAGSGPMVIVGTERGLAFSETGGRAWEARNNGIYCDKVHSLAQCEDMLLISTDRGIYKSPGVGEPWELVLENTAPDCYPMLASDDGLSIAIVDHHCAVSDDCGMSWRVTDPSFELQSYPKKVMIDQGTIIVSAFETQVISNDIGDTWRALDPG